MLNCLFALLFALGLVAILPCQVETSTSIRPFESGQLKFRAELFNAFNHTQWGPATSTTLIANVNAGRISSTRPPRQVQFSLTYMF